MPHPTHQDQALHQFPQPGLLGRRTPATISFTGPKPIRISVTAGIPPEATLRGRRPPRSGPPIDTNPEMNVDRAQMGLEMEAGQGEELGPGPRIVTQLSHQSRGDGRRTGCRHTTQGHARVLGVEHHTHALGLQVVL